MQLFDYLPEPALHIDAQGKVLRANNEARNQFASLFSTPPYPIFFDLIDGDRTEDLHTFISQLPTSRTRSLNTALVNGDRIPLPVKLRGQHVDGGAILTLQRQDSHSIACTPSCLRTAILEAQYQNNPGGILLVNDKMEILSFNREFVRIWDIPKEVQQSRDETASLKSVLDKLADPEAFIARVEELYGNREETSIDEVELKDGRTLYRHTYPLFDRTTYLGRVWYFLDITPLKTAQKNLLQNQVFLNTILEHIRDGIIACDAHGNIHLCNQQSKDLLTSPATPSWTPQTLDDLRFPVQDGQALKTAAGNPLKRALKGETVKNEELVVQGENSQFLRVSGQAMYDDQNNKLGAVISMHDITDLNLAKEQLKFMAYHDQLTGLPNRRLFHDLLQHSLKQAHRNRQQIAVLFLDIDNFKMANDLFGHERGDELLKEVAAVLSARLRDSDLLCRWGGDEFIIALLECDGIDGAINVAEKICLSLTDAMGKEASEAHLSLSTGIAIFPDHGQDADLLIRNADMAMYMAKRSGKNRCELFLPAR